MSDFNELNLKLASFRSFIILVKMSIVSELPACGHIEATTTPGPKQVLATKEHELFLWQ